MPTEPVKPEAKSAEGPEAEFSFKLPIKFPHKLVLYLITVLLGGGTLWTSCDQNQVRSDTELVSKATYGTLADKLNQAVTRLAVAETRIENLERVVYSRSSRPPTAGPMTALHSDTPEPPPPAPVVQEAKLPSYERVKEMLQERRGYAPAAK